MNKITSTLAGLAVVAAASVVPAMAQGNLFSPPGGFNFGTTSAGVFTATGTGATFNPINSSTPVTNESFTLTGTRIDMSNFFNLTSLVITGGTNFTENGPLQFSVETAPSGVTSIASVGAAADGTTFNLTNPVPEASTTVSFGVLLALGGLAVVLRRKSVKNAA